MTNQGITRQGAREDMRYVGINPALSLKVLPTHSKKLFAIAPITNTTLQVNAGMKSRHS